jgi:hypothetical protein
MSILEYSITVFFTQLVFIWSRTWNVRAIADKSIPQVLASGAIVHVTWLLGISIGVVSVKEILINFELSYIPVVLCSLAGGLLGSYIAMKK